MKTFLIFFVFSIGSFGVYAQTDYTVIPLEATPITVIERTEDKSPPSMELDMDASIEPMGSGAGGSEISETTGDLSVSLTGGATYSVPIKVPPGINGIVPTIALSYNSQGGNGMAGYGWNVSGISVITRIPSTKFHDNNIDPVDFDSADRFALDGQRLVLKSGTYGASGAIYETENFSNVKIVSNGVSTYGSSYGPLSFTVTYPDGSVAKYGNSTDSRSRTDYAITSWQDPQGIMVNYTYTAANNSLSIASIKYGHRTGGTAPNEIAFAYKSRKRPEQSFIGGQDFRRKTILSTINVKTGAIGYRNYLLAHNFNTLGFERLTSITEKSGDNSLSFNPISFNYSDSPASLGASTITTSLTVSNIEQRNAHMVPLDYTGDGKMDFIVYPKNRSERTKFWIFQEIQSGNTNIGSQVSTPIFETMFPIAYLDGANKLDKAQGFGLVTHTGTNEVRFKVNGQSTYAPAAQYYEKTWNAPSYTPKYDCTTSRNPERVPLNYISGDFNGDGLTDIIGIANPYSYETCYPILPRPGESCGDCCRCETTNVPDSKVYFINLDRRISTGFTNRAGTLETALQSDHRLLTADFNGDGKTDILHVTSGKIDVYTLNSANGLVRLWSTTDSRIRTDYPLYLGDYNGDGKTDFMMPTANNSATFALFLSTGVQFSLKIQVYPFTYKQYSIATSPINSYDLIPTDINGDGRTDILEYKTTTHNGGANGSQTVGMYYNTFSTVSEVTPAFSFIKSATKTGTLNHLPIPVFLSPADRSNNNLDFVTISNNTLCNFTFGKDNREDMLLRSISNKGTTHNITYRDLDPHIQASDTYAFYETRSDQVYPFVDIDVARGTKLVATLQRSVSGTTTIKQHFAYQGAVAHVDGLGFMGFIGLARSDWSTQDSDRIWNITKHDIAKRGAVSSSYSMANYFTLNSIPPDYIAKTTYVNASSLAANKVFKISNTSNLVQNGLDGTAITTSYLYDAYNNPTKITVDYSGQGSSVTDLTYGNSTGTTYYIGRPLTKKNTTTIGDNAFSTEENYTYTGYLVTTKNYKGDGTPFDSETYTYDVFGNIKTKTITPNGETARQLKYDYDTSGRYLVKSYDVENLATSYEYNTTTGTLKKETNPFGLVTQYLYDTWNRLTKVTDYLGKNVNTTYVETSNTYTVTVTADDGGSTIAVYDPLQRLVKESKKDVLGQWVNKSYQYDKFDRVWKESEPYIGTAASQWNTTEYDLYGRPKTLISYTGKVTNISYSGLTVTVNDGTKTVATTKNALGNVTQVTDPGGTIAYTYFGNGAMKSSTYSGIAQTIEQDGWGRRTKLIDPSAGTYTYAYNGFGELTKETTPKGVTDYTYSTVGKLTQKKVTGDANTNMIINYSYDATSKLPTSIALATNADGNTGTTTIAYDSYKRVTSTIETNSHAKFTKWFTYDAFGKVATEESEGRLLSNNKFSKIKVKNTYANGQLKNVNDFATNEELWNITGLNARGQVTTSTMGVALRHTNTYDTYGYLTQALSQKNVTTSPVELIKLSFNFNVQRGILNSRTNSLFAWTENFTYDSQDRLLSFNDNNGAKNQDYDNKGRINTLSNLGTFTYNSTNYQNTGLTLNPTGESYYNNFTTQNITYNAFKSPVEIHENGKDRIGFQYNAGMGRATMYYGGTQATKEDRPFRKHYSQDGSMEIKWEKATGRTTFVTYVGGDAYSSPVIYHSDQGSTTTAQYLYLHRDYLGSILGITDKNGTFKEKRHFDAWGNIVKLTDGNNAALTKFAVLDRGYTGHEHLQEVNLIHMNGRLYDSMLHRFLMPDNFVQDPYSTLSYNRYSYVLNNPLMYTDANGEFFWFAVIAGAVIGAVAQAVKPGANFGTIVGGGLIGAVAGMVGAGVGSVVAGGGFFSSGMSASMGFWGGAASGSAGGFAGGFVGSTGTSWMNGANFGEGLGSGLTAGVIGGVTG
ncbi:FG-GAP-like repeat-containing protein, partial [Arenibacter lacus]|uniref:FG-GAP-like repeat-containing protein n=2 Tax=Arenibacter TaxID=178469 RepID=UPI00123DBEDF